MKTLQCLMMLNCWMSPYRSPEMTRETLSWVLVLHDAKCMNSGIYVFLKNLHFYGFSVDDNMSPYNLPCPLCKLQAVKMRDEKWVTKWINTSVSQKQKGNTEWGIGSEAEATHWIWGWKQKVTANSLTPVRNRNKTWYIYGLGVEPDTM